MAIKRQRRKPSEIVGPDNRWENSRFWIEHGIDLEKRTISIFGDIDDENSAYIVRGIRKMLEINNDISDPKSAIDVEITTEGGDVYLGFAIYSALAQSPVIIRTHAKGKVMSAGFFIYLAGDQRYSDEETAFMIHGVGSDGIGGREASVLVDAEEVKRINKRMFRVIGKHTLKNASWWERKTKNLDFYFDFDEAKKLGVVTDTYDMETVLL